MFRELDLLSHDCGGIDGGTIHDKTICANVFSPPFYSSTFLSLGSVFSTQKGRTFEHCHDINIAGSSVGHWVEESLTRYSTLKTNVKIEDEGRGKVVL